MEMNLTKTAQRYGGIIELTLQKVRYSLSADDFHANEQSILAKYTESCCRMINQKRSWTSAGNGLRWSNSYALLLAGWKALGVEGDPQKFALLSKVYGSSHVLASNSLATPDNICALLRDFVEENFGVLCDIDGNDYWVLGAFANFRPGLSGHGDQREHPPPLRFVVKFDPDFQLRYHFYGYSIAALEDLCAQHDYGILELEYNNAFLAPREFGAAHFAIESVYREGYFARPERKERFASI